MKNIRIEIKWAIIFIIMTILWMVFERTLGLHGEKIKQHAIYTNLIAIPAVLIYVLAMLDKRKNFYGGYMSYTQGFKTGLIMTAFITILTPLTQFIFSEWISPAYFGNAIEYAVAEEKMERKDAEDYFNLKSYMIYGATGAFIMGLVTSAIVAIFVRRTPPVSTEHIHTSEY